MDNKKITITTRSVERIKVTRQNVRSKINLQDFLQSPSTDEPLHNLDAKLEHKKESGNVINEIDMPTEGNE